jgi:hypothetical protein
VHRAGHTVDATWDDGTINKWDCSPSTKSGPGGQMPTPLVKNDLVGKKCGKCHTNHNRDGMAWFTGFKSHNLQIGFHDSQQVAKSKESHGCVRVPCAIARTIHDHSASDKTTITVEA